MGAIKAHIGSTDAGTSPVTVLTQNRNYYAPRRYRLEALQLGRAVARHRIMSNIEMNASAALYLGSDWYNAKEQGPRIFPTAAQAIRFAMEEAAPVSLKGALMVVKGQSFSGADIAGIYRGSDYPFRHKVSRRYRPSRTVRQMQLTAN